MFSCILLLFSGGLKKFLERYPEDFVMSNDHPFNPHVYLRNPIAVEEHTGSGLNNNSKSEGKGSSNSSSTSGKIKKVGFYLNLRKVNSTL